MSRRSPVAMLSGALPRLEPLRSVRADVLEAASFEAGPRDGEAALLLHELPDDVHRYVDVVLRLVAQSRTDREIAATLVLSEKTVARHLTTISGKTGVDNSAGAAAFALRHGLA